MVYGESEGIRHFHKPQKWMSMLEWGADKFLLLSVPLQMQNAIYVNLRPSETVTVGHIKYVPKPFCIPEFWQYSELIKLNF
jgi:hypothetical protein